MKKVLAWAVALALVLSSFTMAFAADTAKTSKDFSDADQIHYNEAVDVMVATGIINGFPDGTFGPQKTVKRSEMAKMIACIMNGGEDVGDQYKSACPFKDSQKHWAAGYIAYCASEHIIDGRSADVFDPEATVTGTEVAKMALTSLGYDSKIQGYTGETWAANVLKDAKKNDLFKDLDKSFVPGNPCDRESAAQILFNMLKATEVEYSNNTSISVGGDTQVVVSSKAEPVKKDDQTVELYEDVFNGKLNLDPTKKTDDFERPAHAWTYPDTKTEVGTYPDSADYEFTAKATPIDKAIEAYDKDLAKEIKDANITPEVKVNGTTGTLALGDKVELYYDKQKKTCKAVVTQYKPYQIKSVNTKIKDAPEGVTAKITFDGDLARKEFTNKEIAGYDESSYVKDAIIAVAVGKDGKILDSYVPKELVAGKVTKTKSGKVTINGTEYEPSTPSLNVYGDTAVKVGSDYTIYDYNGYMFAAEFIKAPKAEVFYGVVTATKHTNAQTEWQGDEGTPAKDYVRILTPAGEYEEYELAKAETGTDTVTAAIADLISYEKNEDGTIKITAIADSTKPLGNGDKVKTGDVLYGKQLSSDVAAFELVPANPNVENSKAEWKVYSLDNLKAAEKINAKEYFEETEAGLVVMKVEGFTEQAQPDVTFGFLTKAEGITNDTGAAYELTLVGEDQPYTTVGKDKKPTEYGKIKGYVEDRFDKLQFKAEYVKLTLDGDLVQKVEFAKCQGVNAPVKEFPTITGETKADAVFFTTKTTPQFTVAENIYKVLGTSETFLNVGTTNSINNQTVTNDAKVLYVNEKGELEESSFGSIEADNYVILMQMDPTSASWDTVIYTDKLPAGYDFVNK